MNVLYYQSGCSECAKEERNALMKDLTRRQHSGRLRSAGYGLLPVRTESIGSKASSKYTV